MNDETYTPEEVQKQIEEEAQRRRDDAMRWLDSQGHRDLGVGMSLEEFEALKSLIGNPAFGIFWSLIRNAKLQHQQVLVNTTLGSPERDAAAAVIQGHIRAFDQLRDMLVQIADPREQAAADGAV